jgi:hypothetical protein
MQRQLVGMMTALVGVATSAASAQSVRLEQYQHPAEPKFETFNRLYLAGVRDGLIAYSVAAKDHMFCLPPSTVLSPEQTEEIMLRFAEKRHLPGSILIALPLLGGLKEAYPCDKIGD